MITQQLIDYIKQELGRGVSKEEIKKNLMANNWSTQDIEDSFNNLSNPNIPKPEIKTPGFVKIVAWIMLLGGIFRLLVSGPVMLLGFGLKSFPVVFSGILAVLIGIGLIAASFGLRNMRKWGLYAFTVITGLSLISLIYSIVSSSGKEIWEGLVILVIQAAILIDFWTFRKKFV